MPEKNRIRELREQRGMSRRRLAREIGVAPTTISRWESGAIKTIPVDRLQHLAEFFRVSVPFLLGFTGGNGHNGDNGEAEVA